MTTTADAWLTGLDSYFTPSASDFAAAKSHKQSIEARLDYDVGAFRVFEIGSLRHGTGVWYYSDVDYLASLKGFRPASSTTMLERVKSSLQLRFPSTNISIRRPAVVCTFSDAIVEVVPGYVEDAGGYLIADPVSLGGWIMTYPEKHNDYVNDVNRKHGGGVKALARQLKVWKYKRNVPVSSCYLEMRAAKYMDGQNSYSGILDLYYCLSELKRVGLAAMNDPAGLGSRFTACSSEAMKSDAISKLTTAVDRALKAKDFYIANDDERAKQQLALLFNR
jgi:hypothetical protein